ncbi:serine hydrolase [Clostridium sp. YIM B02506]|uniref:serine hydrolase n=1 Tax=Clostridium sp. YIM B02506 TaxID=2910680 RepID=UPI001EED2EA9|nr:serine hydrolase [Clostridium sp. YIM B02506]
MERRAFIGFSLTAIIFISLGIFNSSSYFDENVQAIESLQISEENEENLLSSRKNENNINIQEEMSYIRKVSVQEETSSLENLENKIKDYLGNELNNVGLIYYDLTTNKKISINGDELFTAASTYKVGMNIVAYNMVKEGFLSLNDSIKYSSGYYEEGTGILQSQIDTTLNSPISIQKLLDYAIIYSDNIATNMITEKLGGFDSVRQAVSYFTGVSEPTVSGNVITPETEFRLLKNLYSNRFDQYHSHLIEVMKNTEFHDRIDKYLPYNLVAHKIGSYDSYINDVGIIFTDKPYILVIYTNELTDATEKIATLSNIIYSAQLQK